MHKSLGTFDSRVSLHFFIWNPWQSEPVLNSWHLGGAPASGAGPTPRLFGGTSQASYKSYFFAWAVYRTLTLAHLEGVGDRGLPSVDLALVAV